jgi:transposase-like protein
VKGWEHDETDAVFSRGAGAGSTAGAGASSEYETQWAAITSIASKIGCSAETLRQWVRRTERDTGSAPG